MKKRSWVIVALLVVIGLAVLAGFAFLGKGRGKEPEPATARVVRREISAKRSSSRPSVSMLTVGCENTLKKVAPVLSAPKTCSGNVS